MIDFDVLTKKSCQTKNTSRHKIEKKNTQVEQCMFVYFKYGRN